MKYNVAILVLVAGLLVSPTVSYAEKTLEQRIPDSLKQEDRSFLTLTVENDLFGGAGNDENYTSGIRLTYFNAFVEPHRLASTLADYIPFFNNNQNTNVYYSLGQNMYTPKVITTATPDPTDRPYAAFTYGSVGYSTIKDNHLDNLEVTIGVVGPAAQGEAAQKFVHEIVKSPDPKGWDSQLENEPGLILAYNRSWPEALAKDFGAFYFRAAPHIGTTLGNVYTYGNAGFTLQMVPSRHKWQAPPPRVRPSIPGSGYFSVPSNNFAWSVFTGFEGRAVARNIFLDGNTFADSPSVDKKYTVYDANAGFTVTYGRTQLAYTVNWRSDEFYGQKEDSLFGSVSLGYRF